MKPLTPHQVARRTQATINIRKLFDKSTRKCTKCLKIKPMTAEFFAVSDTGRHGLHNSCLTCGEAYQRLRLERSGLTPEGFASMAEKQGHCCAVCKENGELIVDMLSTGRKPVVRGLVCSLCSVMLVKARWLPQRLRAAADYIDANQPKEPKCQTP